MRAFVAKDDAVGDILFEFALEWNPKDGIFVVSDQASPENEDKLEAFLKEGKIEPRRLFELVSGTAFQATIGALGWDIYAAGYNLIPAGGTKAVGTGIKTRMSPDLYAEIVGRSGLALKGIDVLGGQIDSDYRDEWKVILQNNGAEAFRINDGDRIAQFKIKVKEVVTLAGKFLVGSQERKGGFGSTGV